jgi:Ca2+-binding RTX toxin-like protein
MSGPSTTLKAFKDTATGHRGHDTATGHRGHDTATGHRGHDTATGHRGHDTATVVIAVGASTIQQSVRL